MLGRRKESKEIREVLSLSARILRIFYVMLIIAIIFVGTLLIKEWGILTFILTVLKLASPLFFGFMIAWIFNPLVVKLHSKGLNRLLGTIIIYSIFLLIIYIFFSILIPTLYNQLVEFIGTIPGIVGNIENVINNLFSNLESNDLINVENLKTNIIVGIQGYGNTLIENLPNVIFSSVGSIISGIGVLSLSLIIGFYMLFDFDNIKINFVELIPNKYRYEISVLLENIGGEIRNYVNSTLFIAFLVFVGSTLGFALIGLKAPIFFGLICGIVDLVLFVGPIIGGVIAALVGFSQSPFVGIAAIIVVLIVQQLEGIVFRPIVISKNVKPNPIIVIVALIIFGYYFGILGLLLVPPFLSIMKLLLKYVIAKFDLEVKEEEQDV